MIPTFSKWLTQNCNTIGIGPKSIQIDFENGKKITLNGYETIDNVIHVENYRLKSISNSKPQLQTVLHEWFENTSLRYDVIKKLLEYFIKNFKESINKTNNIKIKGQYRISALKNILERKNETNILSNLSLPDCYTQRIFLTSTHCSLVAIANQLAPYLLAGVPICLATNTDSSLAGLYLLELLKHFGLPDGIVEHLIGFNINQEGQTLTFVLFGDADVDAALDSAFDAFIEYGLSSIKVFAQESLKNQIETILYKKLETVYTLNDLIVENELFSITNSIPFEINTDAVDFENISSGLDCFYFRSLPEALKMINFLKGRLEKQLVSVWSENGALAIRFCSQISVTSRTLINSHISESFFQGFFDLGLALCKIVPGLFDKLELKNFSKNSQKWASLSIYAISKIIEKALMEANILTIQNCSTKISHSFTNEDFLEIIHTKPVGILSINYCSKVDETDFLNFILKGLVSGNCVIINGDPPDAFHSIQQALNSQGYDILLFKPELTENISFSLFIDYDSSSGTYHISGLHLDNIWSDYKNFVTLIEHSIKLSLPEIDMAKIVE